MPEAEKSNKGLIIGIATGAVAVVAAVVVILIIILGGSPKLEGKWTLTSFKEGDKEYSSDVLGKLGMDKYTIEFKSDGKGVMTTFDGEHEFTYDADKKIMEAEGDKQEFKLDGGKLVIEMDGGIMTFKK